MEIGKWSVGVGKQSGGISGRRVCKVVEAYKDLMHVFSIFDTQILLGGHELEYNNKGSQSLLFVYSE